MILDIDTEILIKNVVVEILNNGRKEDIKRRRDEVSKKLKRLEYFEDLKNDKQH